MNYLEAFKQHLLQVEKSSLLTVKNYLADVRKFIRWFETRFNRSFEPRLASKEVIELYRTDLQTQNSQSNIASAKSFKRYLSSLRKFYGFLKSQNLVIENPLDLAEQEIKEPIDPWHLKEFSNNLYLSHASKATIKNYLMDVRQFTSWVETVLMVATATANQTLLERVDSKIVEEYKNRMLYDGQAAPTSVNRKLSSLRRYLAWAKEQGFTGTTVAVEPAEVSVEMPAAAAAPEETLEQPTPMEAFAQLATEQEVEEKPYQYASFPPLRLLQKIIRSGSWIFDLLVLLPVVNAIVAIRYAGWKATGANVFKPLAEMTTASAEIATAAHTAPAKAFAVATTSALDTFVTQRESANQMSVKNFPKSFYAPLAISTTELSFKDKLLYYLKHYRPNWYKKYHSYRFVHYIHFAVFLIYATILGLTIYQAFTDSQHFHAPVLASMPASPPRLLAFEGTLSDATNTPITAAQTLRFTLYNSATGTGSALLWQEIQPVSPDDKGHFSTLLGRNQPIYQSLLSDNSNLFLGITIGSKDELAPRQQIATVKYSQDAEKVQGMAPITQTDAGTKNVILALNSAGNLVIGGSASPRFEATGGEFTLSGKTLTLTTLEGSNTNIQLNPDGTGIVDIQKPIQNTTNYINAPGVVGAVEFDDSVAILATSSSQAALVINQNSTGNLISASGSGTAKFTVDYVGAGMFADDLAVNGNNLTTDSSTFNLLNRNVINLNIGGSATAISIGTTSGVTTINNSLRVNGTTTLQGAVNAKGLVTTNGGLTVPTGQNVTLSGFSTGAIPFINGDKIVAQDFTNFSWDENNKRLGLGTNAPQFRLDVQDDQTNNSITSIYNKSASSDADGLLIKLGNTSPTAANNFVTFMNGNGNVIGKITGGAAIPGNSIVYNASGADYAEYYKKANPSEALEQGDVVCIAPMGGVTKCNETQSILGVVSTTAGFVGAGNHDNDPAYVLVGIVGQLPVKVEGAGSGVAITAGDPLSVSSNGIVKATKKGTILGRALESTDPIEKKNQLITVAINVGYYDPELALSSQGDVLPTDHTAKQSTIDKIASNIIGNINLGMNEVGDSTVNSPTITAINAYIGSLFAEQAKTWENKFFARRIISPIAEISQVRTNYITPLAENPNVALRFDDGSIAIVNPKISSTSAVARIDNEGNASFSGTLRAKRIIADEIQGLNIQNATAAATYITNITNVYNTTSSASATPAPTRVLAETKPASFSGKLASFPTFLPKEALAQEGIENISADFGKFNQGLIALGASSFTDVAVTGILHLGESMTFSDNSINTIGTELALQPLRQGDLSIMGGLVKVNTEGDLSVGGTAIFAKDVTIKGNLFANLLAPVPGSDLTIKLADKKQSVTIHDSQDNETMRINQLGDIIASGSGKFANVASKAFTIVRGAQADTSFTKTVASSSAGTAIIKANQTERTIVSPYMKPNSLIYLTAASNTQDVTPYIARQTKKSFTIQIQHAVIKDIKINWWIVN